MKEHDDGIYDLQGQYICNEDEFAEWMARDIDLAEGEALWEERQQELDAAWGSFGWLRRWWRTR